MKTQLINKVALLSSALILAVAAAPVGADSACKGLEKRQCESKADCTWVDGYTRKDGVKVASYCKGKGGKKGSASSTSKGKK